jgi:MFS family permease
VIGRQTTIAARQAERTRPVSGGRPAAFVATAVVFAALTMGPSLPSPLASLYESAARFSTATVTGLYVSYALGVIATLWYFGRTSREPAPRVRLLVGVGLAVVSALIYAVTTSVVPLAVARVCSGLSVGAVTGSATASLIELGGPGRQQRSAGAAVAVNIGGLALGTMFGGAASVGGNALHTPFWCYLVLIAIAASLIPVTPARLGAVAASNDESPVVREAVDRGEPSPRTQVSGRQIVWAGIPGAIGFAINGLATTVASIYLTTLVGLSQRWVAGLVVAVVFIATAFGQVLVARFGAARAVRVGRWLLCAGLAVLILAFERPSPAAFVAAEAVIGTGTGLCVGGGLLDLVGRSQRHQHARISSTYFAFLYWCLLVPVIAAGVLEQRIGVVHAGVIASIVAACGVIASMRGRARARVR